MTNDAARDRAVRDALNALDSAKAKMVSAGLMLAAAGLKDHKAVVHLRGVVGGLACARDWLKIDQASPVPPTEPEVPKPQGPP